MPPKWQDLPEPGSTGGRYTDDKKGFSKLGNAAGLGAGDPIIPNTFRCTKRTISILILFFA